MPPSRPGTQACTCCHPPMRQGLCVVCPARAQTFTPAPFRWNRTGAAVPVGHPPTLQHTLPSFPATPFHLTTPASHHECPQHHDNPLVIHSEGCHFKAGPARRQGLYITRDSGHRQQSNGMHAALTACPTRPACPTQWTLYPPSTERACSCPSTLHTAHVVCFYTCAWASVHTYTSKWTTLLV